MPLLALLALPAFSVLLGAAAPLTLPEALLRAARQNPELVAARLDEHVATAGIEAAGQLSNPTVAVSVGPDEPTVFGSVDVKLPLFGQRGAAIDAARAEVPVAQAELAAQAVKLRAAVRRAYFALAASEAQEVLAAETARIAAQLAQMTEARFRTGNAPRLDAEQAALAEKRAGQDALDRASLSLAARVALAQLTGDPPDTELHATDALLPVPQPPPLEALLGKLVQSPEVQALEHRREAALLRADRERAAIRPLPDVSLEVERLSGSPSLGLRAGLAFELPILSQNRGNVHTAEAQANAAEAQARAALQRLAAQLRAARARWDAAARRARFYEAELVPAALRLLEMARAGYELGRTPLFSVLQAQSDAASARARALDAASEAQAAFADVEEAAGVF